METRMKLELDGLRVETFATQAEGAGVDALPCSRTLFVSCIRTQCCEAGQL
jgi:hypothetical protein